LLPYLLDTNIVSLIVKRNLQISQKIEDVQAQRKSIFISCITYFEVKRGFLAVDSPKQRERFNKFCQKYPIILSVEKSLLAITQETVTDNKRI
jgi:tRNA(fMet)-specific endonuclease VapC